LVNLLLSPHIHRHVYLSQCPSTNDYVMQGFDELGNSNTCVYTFEQTLGRGQRGNSWFSDKHKNLTCTYKILLQDFAASEQFQINRIFALAVHDFISSFKVKNVAIKWPNDIYIGDRKVAGILIQNNLRAAQINSSLLGVGININQEEFPSNLPNPISLHQDTGETYDLVALQLRLSSCLELRMSQIEELEKTNINYQSLLFRLNQEAKFRIDESEVLGTIKGVTSKGKLEVEQNGQLRYFDFKEIEYL